jgi:hypothetical protein
MPGSSAHAGGSLSGTYIAIAGLDLN